MTNPTVEAVLGAEVVLALGHVSCGPPNLGGPCPPLVRLFLEAMECIDQFLGHHTYTKIYHLEQVIRCGLAPEPDNICTFLLIRMAIHYSMGITVTQKEIHNLQLCHHQSDMVVVRAGVKLSSR